MTVAAWSGRCSAPPVRTSGSSPPPPSLIPPKWRGSHLNDELSYPGYEGPWPEWEDAYLEALHATGQRERAQQFRWAAFEERLSVNRLRAYLKLLPDFDDVLAEEKALAYALGFPGFTS